MSVTWNTDDDMTPAQAAAEHAAQDATRWAVRDALLAAPEGLTNTYLVHRFGMSAIKRLNDLKQHHGYDYTREYVGLWTWRYRLIAPPTRGTLASLQPVAYLDARGIVQSLTPAATDPQPRAGRLF